ncbi:HET-domain-containing protein [Daldinia bambusicola]|nr:HET-domain-containing protein [Daldinia bambusicola]
MYSWGRKERTGYWRQFNTINYYEGSNVCQIAYVKELEALMPATSTNYDQDIDRGALAATGNIKADGSHVGDDTQNLQSPNVDEEDSADLSKNSNHFNAFKNRPNQGSLRKRSIGIYQLREMESGLVIAIGCLQKWMKDCELDHPSCGHPQLNHLLPTRVIYVFASDRGVPVIETSGTKGRYVTLSYCWQSIHDLRQCIAASFLPKTFQDAIKITQRLGIKYLWIDRLCIIQDDPDGWKTETAAISHVYRNSYSTMPATAPNDSHSRDFSMHENRLYVSPASISLRYDTPREVRGPRSHKIVPNYLFEEWLPGSSFHSPQGMEVGSFGKRYDAIADEPLSSRAWTLQEHLIHYVCDQMYFECGTSIQSEDRLRDSGHIISYQKILAPLGIGDLFHCGAGSRRQVHRRQMARGCLSLIEGYSMRNLTVYRNTFTALAGLWQRYFIEDLCWRMDAKITPLTGKDLGTLHGPVKYIPLFLRNIASRIINCRTVPVDKNPYDRVSSDKLDIARPVHQVRPHIPKKRWDRHETPIEIDLEDGRDISAGSLHSDVPEESISYPCYTLFLGLSKALILRTKDLKVNRNEDRTEDPDVAFVSKPAMYSIIHIGAGAFIKGPTKKKKDRSDDGGGDGEEEEEQKEPKVWNKAKQGKLTLDKILHVEEDQSWRLATKNDPTI